LHSKEPYAPSSPPFARWKTARSVHLQHIVSPVQQDIRLVMVNAPLFLPAQEDNSSMGSAAAAQLSNFNLNPHASHAQSTVFLAIPWPAYSALLLTLSRLAFVSIALKTALPASPAHFA
jgi:hypothetical protein